MTKEITVEIQEVSTKLKTADGVVEFIFTPLKHNEFRKLQIDLGKIKDKSVEEIEQLDAQYAGLPIEKLKAIKGQLKDFGEDVSLEQIKKGEMSSALYKAITALFWQHNEALNPKKEEEKKEQAVTESAAA